LNLVLVVGKTKLDLQKQVIGAACRANTSLDYGRD
jgi:hypothetical protein